MVYCLLSKVKEKIHSCGVQLKSLKDEYDAAKEAWVIEESVVLQNEQWYNLLHNDFQYMRQYTCPVDGLCDS